MKIENAVWIGGIVTAIIWLTILGVAIWAIIRLVLHFT